MKKLLFLVILATAISVLGAKAGLELIEKIDGVECFLVAGDAENPVLQRSIGFDEFLD